MTTSAESTGRYTGTTQARPAGSYVECMACEDRAVMAVRSRRHGPVLLCRSCYRQLKAASASRRGGQHGR